MALLNGIASSTLLVGCWDGTSCGHVQILYSVVSLRARDPFAQSRISNGPICRVQKCPTRNTAEALARAWSHTMAWKEPCICAFKSVTSVVHTELQSVRTLVEIPGTGNF